MICFRKYQISILIKYQRDNLFIKESILPSFNFSHFNLTNFFALIFYILIQIFSCITYFFLQIKMASRRRILRGDPKTDLLVSERRQRNHEFHYRHRSNKTKFWESIVRRIRKRYNITFSARQVKQKWKNLRKDYDVSK